MIEWLVPSLSTYSHYIDGLFGLITVIMGVFFFAAEFLIVYYVIKFNKKKHPRAIDLSGDNEEDKVWVKRSHITLLVCDIVIIAFTIFVWHHIKQQLPPADSTIRVYGQQWAWHFQHPGADGVLDTSDDINTTDELHIQKGKVYHYKLRTKDVLHSFSVPVFRLKQDAVPGREITGWFEATGLGTYDIQCAEMCGIGHGLMGARIVIEDEAQHAAWVNKNTPPPTNVANL